MPQNDEEIKYEPTISRYMNKRKIQCHNGPGDEKKNYSTIVQTNGITNLSSKKASKNTSGVMSETPTFKTCKFFTPPQHAEQIEESESDSQKFSMSPAMSPTYQQDNKKYLT